MLGIKISQKDNVQVITDLESTNGTKLNGVKVFKAVLQPGAAIDVGKTRLVFDLLDDAEQVMLYPENHFQGMLDESVNPSTHQPTPGAGAVVPQVARRRKIGPRQAYHH